MRASLYRVLPFVLALAPFACNDPDPADSGVPPTDAPVDSRADTGNDTGTVDTGVADAGFLFTPCRSATGCPGPRSTARCITVDEGYPGGFCSRTCTLPSQCGEDGVCAPFGSERLCLQACAENSACREGYSCRGITVGSETVRVCLPACTSDTQCQPEVCSPYRGGFCGSHDSTLADNGAPCTRNGDCRSGLCFEELDTTTMMPTGYLEGDCYSRCVIPADTAYRAATMPRGNCPTGSVCVKGTAAAGDGGLCRKECTTNADCRSGYICSHPTRLGMSTAYTNGYCAPLNCHYRNEDAGVVQVCPSGASCNTTRTSDAGVPTSGFCVRTGDGGVGDASAPSDTPVDTAADGPIDATGDAPRDGGATMDASGGG